MCEPLPCRSNLAGAPGADYVTLEETAFRERVPHLHRSMRTPVGQHPTSFVTCRHQLRHRQAPGRSCSNLKTPQFRTREARPMKPREDLIPHRPKTIQSFRHHISREQIQGPLPPNIHPHLSNVRRARPPSRAFSAACAASRRHKPRHLIRLKLEHRKEPVRVPLAGPRSASPTKRASPGLSNNLKMAENRSPNARYHQTTNQRATGHRAPGPRRPRRRMKTIARKPQPGSEKVAGKFRQRGF